MVYQSSHQQSFVSSCLSLIHALKLFPEAVRTLFLRDVMKNTVVNPLSDLSHGFSIHFCPFVVFRLCWFGTTIEEWLS
jgi:hypothetical protein